jgi:hypothetical protein
MPKLLEPNGKTLSKMNKFNITSKMINFMSRYLNV